MFRISTGLSVATAGAVLGCLALLPGTSPEGHAASAGRRPDFSSVSVDRMPVGTVKRVIRARQVRVERKA